MPLVARLFSLVMLAVLAFCANAAPTEEANLRFKRVPRIHPVVLGKLSPAYDWIVRERIRGMYCYAGQFAKQELMDSIVGSGFNTILVHAMGAAMSETGWPEEVTAWAHLQQTRPLHVIVSWPFGSDERYRNTQFGAYDTGTSTRFSNTPCPLSREYWDKVVGDRAVIAAQSGLAGFVVDMEMYGADQTWYSGPCYCDQCWSRFFREYSNGFDALTVPAAERAEWAKRHQILSDYERWQELTVAGSLQKIREKVRKLKPDFLLGYLHSIEPLRGLARGLGTSRMPALIFGEREYKGRDDGWYNVSQFPERLKHLRDGGYPAMYVTGLWVQPVPPADFPRLVETLGAPQAGYWIWSSAAFSPQASGEYALAPGHTRDDYWQAFRAANTGMDKRRDKK